MFPWIVFPAWTRVSQRPPKWHARAQALLSLVHLMQILPHHNYPGVSHSLLNFPISGHHLPIMPFHLHYLCLKGHRICFHVTFSITPILSLKYPLCTFLNLHYSTLFLVTHTSFSFPKPLSLYTALNYYYMSLSLQFLFLYLHPFHSVSIRVSVHECSLWHWPFTTISAAGVLGLDKSSLFTDIYYQIQCMRGSYNLNVFTKTWSVFTIEIIKM